MKKFDARIARTEIVVVSDVNNPLCGPRGAARVYGPQKGVDALVSSVDRVSFFAEVIKNSRQALINASERAMRLVEIGSFS